MDLAKTHTLTDEQRLAQLGHQQELRRTFSLPALLSLCICLMATWEATSTVIATALQSGGPPCLIYNLQVLRSLSQSVAKTEYSILSLICSLCIAASLAEIASIYPTAGGTTIPSHLIWAPVDVNHIDSHCVCRAVPLGGRAMPCSEQHRSFIRHRVDISRWANRLHRICCLRRRPTDSGFDRPQQRDI